MANKLKPFKDVQDIQLVPPGQQPRVNIPMLRQLLASIGIVARPDGIESDDFEAGVSGWKLYSNGDFEGNDGIFRGNVTVKSLVVDQNYMQIAFESLDGWFRNYLEGTSAAVALARVGMANLHVGKSANGNRTVLGFEHGDGRAFSSDYDSFFQVSVVDDGERHQDLGICMGDYDPFDITVNKYGIKYILADQKVYGFYTYSGTEVKIQLATGFMDETQVWRAEFNATTRIISFYINGVLIATIDTTAHALDIDADAVVAFGGKQRSNTDNWYSNWTNMYLYFNT